MSPASPNWFYLYLLRSIVNKSIYNGCTSNLSKRLTEHNKCKIYSTRKMLPIELIYFEAFKSKKDAFEREKKLKYHGTALRNLKLRIKNSFKGEAG